MLEAGRPMGVACCPEEHIKKKRTSRRSVQSSVCNYPLLVSQFVEIEPQVFGTTVLPKPQFSEALLLQAGQITKARKTNGIYEHPSGGSSSMVPFERPNPNSRQQDAVMQQMSAMVNMFGQLMGNASAGGGPRQGDIPLTFLNGPPSGLRRTSSAGSLEPPTTPAPKGAVTDPGSGTPPLLASRKRALADVDDDEDDEEQPPAMKKPAAASGGPTVRQEEIDMYIKKMLEETETTRAKGKAKAKAKAKGKAKAKAKACPTSTSTKAPPLPALKKQPPISYKDYAIYTDEKNSKWRVKKVGVIWDKMFSWGTWGAYGGDEKKAWKAVVEWIDGDKGNW